MKYCIAIDKYEDKMENGGPLSDGEKMVYYGAKAWVGDKLDKSQESEYTQSFGNVLHDNILDTYKNSDKKSVNSDIRILSSLDSDLAGDVNSTLAGVRVEEANRQQRALNSSLRDAEIKQGNEIASNIIRIDLPLNTMGLENTDPNRLDARICREVKAICNEQAKENMSEANRTGDPIAGVTGLLWKALEVAWPNSLSLGDVSTASTGGIIKREIQGEAKAASQIEQQIIKNEGKRTWQEAGITIDEATRIQNAANKTNQEITVVGSRASGTATSTSDWDYIMSGNSKQIHSVKNSVPRGTQGGEINSMGNETGIDIWSNKKNPVDTSLPHVIFEPKK